MKEAILKVLVEEGYLVGYEVVGEGVTRTLLVELKYYEGKGVIVFIRRKSKPSLLQYCKKSDIPNVKNCMGIVIMTTPKGVITGKQAKELGVGGKVICEVY